MEPDSQKRLLAFGEAVEAIFTGINPKRQQSSIGDVTTFPTINVRDIQQGEITEIGVLEKVAVPDNSQTDRFKVRSGDVLLTARGIPKIAAVRPEHEGCLVGPNIIVIRPGELLSGPLVLAFLQHPDTQYQLSQRTVGTAVPTLTVKAVSDIKIAIPPSAEQHQLSRLVDLAEQQLRAIRKAAEYRRVLAQELVMRRMTP